MAAIQDDNPFPGITPVGPADNLLHGHTPIPGLAILSHQKSLAVLVVTVPGKVEERYFRIPDGEKLFHGLVQKRAGNRFFAGNQNRCFKVRFFVGVRPEQTGKVARIFLTPAEIRKFADSCVVVNANQESKSRHQNSRL